MKADIFPGRYRLIDSVSLACDLTAKSYMGTQLKTTLTVALVAITVTALGTKTGNPDKKYGRLSVLVVDEKGSPLRGTEVKASPYSGTTTGSGYFFVDYVPAGTVQIEAHLAEFSPAFKPATIVAGLNTSVSLTLLPASTHTIADLGRGNQVKEKGFEVSMPANALEVDGKAATSATLMVSLTDFSKEKGSQSMPGDFRGTTRSGRMAQIESIGAMNATFVNENGRELQVRKGKSVTLSMPLQSKGRLKSKRLPLWSFDEARGIWKEEGVGKVVKKNGKHWIEMKVPHLSWWNVDMPLKSRSSIWVKKFVRADGKEIEGITLLARGLTYNGTSSSAGATPNFLSQQGNGKCVDIKRNARVAVEARLFSTSEIFLKSLTLKANKLASSCDINPEKGMVIDKLLMERQEMTCIRGTVPEAANTGTAALGARVTRIPEFLSEAADNAVYYEAPISNDGSFCIDGLPVREQLWLSVYSDEKGAPAVYVPDLPVNAPKTGAADCRNARKRCYDMKKLNSKLSNGEIKRRYGPLSVVVTKEKQKFKGAFRQLDKHMQVRTEKGIVTLPIKDVERVAPLK